MLTPEQIINDKLEFDKFNFCGIYFLINKNKIIYIGCSINVGTRLVMHRKSKSLQFDSWNYIKYSCVAEMRYYEAKYIHDFKPRYNIQYNPDYENIRMILFAKFRRDFNNINELSAEVNLSTTTLSGIFDLNKPAKDHHIKIVLNYFFPHGIKQHIIDRYKVPEIKRENFDSYKNRTYDGIINRK